jgi:hypothetical protein
MRAVTFATSLLLVAQVVAAEYRHFVSPDGRFKAYTTAAWQDGTGMKLFLRRTRTLEVGALLKESNRWIDAKWSPDSRFLAVIDHLDGHVSDVYVYGVAAAAAAPALLYHTPDLRTYDVKWEVVDWNVARREIILRKEVTRQMPGRITHEKVVAHIGTKPLKLAERE